MARSLPDICKTMHRSSRAHGKTRPQAHCLQLAAGSQGSGVPFISSSLSEPPHTSWQGNSTSVAAYFWGEYQAIAFSAPRPISSTLELTLRAQETPSTQMALKIGKAQVKTFVYNIWNFVFDHETSPLRHIPDVATRHYVLQALALMWALAFSVAIGSYTVFAISVLGHAVLISAAAITVATYSTAAIKPQMFARFASRRSDGEHE
jgi:hypothetical protein